jgi:hypothetical protein
LDAEGYPIGYEKQSGRLLPAFLAAYSGNADDVSLDFRNFHSKLVYKIQWFDALWHL